MKRSVVYLFLLAALLLAIGACSLGGAPMISPTPAPTPSSAQPSSTPPAPTLAAQQVATATPAASSTATVSPSHTATLSAVPTPSVTTTPSATRTLLPSVTPTLTRAVATPLSIRLFQVEARDEVGGKRLTFTWQSTGATSATITSYAHPATPVVWTVAASGVHTVVVPDDTMVANPLVTLVVRGDSGNTASASRVLAWPCRYTFFFSPAPAVCADAAQTSAAAEQAFQYGRMLWVQQLAPGVGPLIYVMYSSGKYDVYPDLWKEGDPTADISSAPAGLQQPTRGFGKIWRDNPNVREKVGWALSREEGFTTLAQAPRPGESQVPVYVRTLSGRVVVFQPTGYWNDVEAVGLSTPTPAPFSVSVTPAGVFLPAGAAATVLAQVPQWQASWPSLTWSLVGPPPGSSSAIEPGANPANVSVQMRTACTVAPGTYPLELTASSGANRARARFYMTVGGSLGDSQPTTLVGSFSENTMDVRRGGPSTLAYGPYVVLTFCDSAQARRLRVTLSQATTAAGGAVSVPPRFSLFASHVWPAPPSIQTMSGGYVPNARQVATNQGWSLEWPIEGGLYLLVFERSPLEGGEPPAYVTYTVDIVQ